jgi:hypothetical protein
LWRRATRFLLGAALQALLAAFRFGVRDTTSARGGAACEFGGTTILGLVGRRRKSAEQRAKDEERTSEEIRKHEKILP